MFANLLAYVGEKRVLTSLSQKSGRVLFVIARPIRSKKNSKIETGQFLFPNLPNMEEHRGFWSTLWRAFAHGQLLRLLQVVLASSTVSLPLLCILDCCLRGFAGAWFSVGMSCCSVACCLDFLTCFVVLRRMSTLSFSSGLLNSEWPTFWGKTGWTIGTYLGFAWFCSSSTPKAIPNSKYFLQDFHQKMKTPYNS